jgi:putative endonuclease
MNRAPTSRQARAQRTGLRAEALAALVLVLKGYRIVARRYAAAGGEIDLIARRGDTVAFVEVKAARMARCVRHWLARNPWAAGLTLRCDAVFLAPRRLPRHVPAVLSLAID